MSLKNIDDCKVTVYIPTKNRASLLKRAVDSIKNQTFKNINIIIVNDGSDNIDVNSYLDTLKNDDSITIINNEESKGACFARNQAINVADGDFITGLDDDDYFDERHIEVLLNLYKEKGVKFIAPSYKRITNDGIFDDSYEGVISSDNLAMSNKVGNQIFATLNTFKSVNGFDETLGAWQDYDMWLRVCEKVGQGYRCKEMTYIVDQSHEWERITTSPLKLKKINSFLVKNKNRISDDNYYKTLFEIEISNRGGTPISDVKKYIFYISPLKLIKYVVKYYGAK